MQKQNKNYKSLETQLKLIKIFLKNITFDLIKNP